MRAAYFALALLPAAALGELGLFNMRDACVSSFLATITITTPSTNSYWYLIQAYIALPDLSAPAFQGSKCEQPDRLDLSIRGSHPSGYYCHEWS
jgi:hypothetical protein